MVLPNELLSQIVESLFWDAQTSAVARQALCLCLSVSHGVRLIARKFVFRDITIELHADTITQPARTHLLWELLVSDDTTLQHISSISIEVVGDVCPTVDPPIFCTLLRMLRAAPLHSIAIRHRKGSFYGLKEFHPTIIDSLVSLRGSTSLRQLHLINAINTPRRLVCGDTEGDTVQKITLPNFYPYVYGTLFDGTDATFNPLPPITDPLPPLPALIDLEVLDFGHFLTAIYGRTTTENMKNWNIRIKRLRILQYIKDDDITTEKQWEMVELAKYSLEALSVVTTWLDITNGTLSSGLL